MITIISDNMIAEQKQQLFISIVEKMTEQSRKEKGCISYTVHQNTQNPLHYRSEERRVGKECRL